MKAVLCALFLMPFALAQAAEPCRGPLMPLSDLRELGALQARIQQECPCPDFDGSPTATSRDYRGCAKALVAEAMAAGELRRACRGEVNQWIRSASCGTQRNTCGQARISTKNRRGRCLLRTSDRCLSDERTARNICDNFTHCADVAVWTSGTCVDPRLPGPHDPGVDLLTISKVSELAPHVDRVLETWIWYPTIPDTYTVDANVGGVPLAPIDPSGAPYPVLAFSHGACGDPLKYLGVIPRLVSHGFVVIAPPHPGSTGPTDPNEPPNLNCLNPLSLAERHADLRAAIDRIVTETLDSSSRFFGMFDPAKIGVGGHSMGGFAAHDAAFRDPRIKVGLAFSPGTGIDPPPFNIPSLTMLGSLDESAHNQAIRSDFLPASVRPKFLVELLHAGHFAWSDRCLFPSQCAPAGLTQEEAHNQVLRWALPFLKVYLAGDESFRPMLDRRLGPPGIAAKTWN